MVNLNNDATFVFGEQQRRTVADCLVRFKDRGLPFGGFPPVKYVILPVMEVDENGHELARRNSEGFITVGASHEEIRLRGGWKS